MKAKVMPKVFTFTQFDKLKQDQKSIFCCLFNYTKHIDEPESNLKKKEQKINK